MLRSFSQLSVTMIMPAMQNPPMNRITAQTRGSISRTMPSAETDMIEANTAKARMWPTVATTRTAWMPPASSPTK